MTGSARTRSKRTWIGSGEMYAIIAVVAQSLVILLQRAAAISVDPIVGSFFNMIPVALVGAVGLGIAHRRNGQAFGRPRALAILAAAGGGLSANVIALPIFLRALSLGGAVIATPAVASSVIWAGLLAWMLLKQPLSRLALYGFVVFLVGLTMLGLGQSSDIPLSERWVYAIPYGVLVAMLYGLTMTLTGYSLRLGLSQSGSVGINGMVSLLGLWLLSLWQSRSIAGIGTDMIMLLLAGLLQAMALVATTAAFARTSVVSVGIILVTNVVWTSLLSWLLLDDALNGVMFVALLVVLAGLILAQYGQSIERKAHG